MSGVVYVIVYGDGESRVVWLQQSRKVLSEDSLRRQFAQDRPGVAFSVYPLSDEAPIDDIAAMFGLDVAASVSNLRRSIASVQAPTAGDLLPNRLASLQRAIRERNDLELAELYLLVAESVAHLVGGIPMRQHSFGDLTLSRPIPRSAT